MDLFTGACTVIATLVIVIPVLWKTIAVVRKKLEAQMAHESNTCRADLDAERAARLADQVARARERAAEKIERAQERAADQAQMRSLEADMRAILTNKLADAVAALVYTGTKLAEFADSHDDMRERMGLEPRIKDPERSTTIAIAAITGARK